VRNFKGIANTTIHLDEEVPGNIITLVGLNESGKTTILEALSNFFSADAETAKFIGTINKNQKQTNTDFIPKDQKASFSGRISISAELCLEDRDVRQLAAHLLSEQQVILDQNSVEKIVEASINLEFVESRFLHRKHIWRFPFSARPKNARKPQTYPNWRMRAKVRSGALQ
jgi:predicted ATP-binding protein involved in virulence